MPGQGIEVSPKLVTPVARLRLAPLVLCLIECDFITMFGRLPAPPTPTPPPSSCSRCTSSHSCPNPFALCLLHCQSQHALVIQRFSVRVRFWLLAQRKLRHYCDSVILLFCAAFLALAIPPSPLSLLHLPPAALSACLRRAKSSCLVDFGISMGFCVLAIRSGY